MNVVDLADQRRAAYTALRRSWRNWLSLFWFLLDMSIVNVHILFTLKRHKTFVARIDGGNIRPNLVGKHELRCDYTANTFRLEVAEHLLSHPARPKPRIRTTYKKKTTAIYFSKHRKSLATQPVVEKGPGGGRGLRTTLAR